MCDCQPDLLFRRKYGDVFAVKAFGRVVTYVVSPSVCRNSWQSLPILADSVFGFFLCGS